MTNTNPPPANAAPAKASAMTPCEKCPWRDQPPFRSFSTEELGFVSKFKTTELIRRPGETVLVEGEGSPELYTVLAGWAFRYKSLPDGRRQILNFALPGDFLGLQTAMMNTMDHSVEALTKMKLCVFPREKVWSLYNNHPGLAFDLTWIASREERILDEALLSIGRRSALERMAYVLLYLFRRARGLRLTQGNDKLVLPFTQLHLADALGLSLVHTNKTLKKLASRNVAHWRDGLLTVVDEPAMARLAEIEPVKSALRPLI